MSASSPGIVSNRTVGTVKSFKVDTPLLLMVNTDVRTVPGANAAQYTYPAELASIDTVMLVCAVDTTVKLLNMG